MTKNKINLPKLRVVVGFCFILLSSCSGLDRQAPIARHKLPDIKVDAYSGVDFGEASRMEILTKMYAPQAGMTACGFLDDMAAAKSYLPGSRFRLVGEMNAKVSDPASAIGAKKKSCFRQCLPFFWGSGACKRCRAERKNELQTFSLDGRVDISASPLYQYALLTQEIPDRKRFLELLEEEIDQSVVVVSPLARLYKWLLKADLVDLYAQRNAIIQDRVNQAFPGAFDTSASNTSLKRSFPEAVLRNGMPNFSTLVPSPSDDPPIKDRKTKELAEILSVYSQSVPVFALSGKWSDFQDEMERGMNLALNAFNQPNPREQACATAIFHRGFTQLLMISGYDRPPMVVDDPEKEVSAFPNLEKLLDNPQGTQFKICPIAGVFGYQGRSLTLYPKDLEAFDPDKKVFSLSKNLPNSAACDLKEAVPMNSWEYKRYPTPRFTQEASGIDLLNFLHGVTHWMVSFNPSASWWTQDTNVTGFPLASFDSLSQISASGGILPVESHVLALALVNVSLAKILRDHTVLLDKNGNEVSSQSEAMFIRFTDKVHKPGSGGKIFMDIRSAALALETVMKINASFERLARWKTESKARLDDDVMRERDPRKKEELMREYSVFVKGMFGGDETFQMITDDSESSLRSRLSKVELSLAMLVSSYVKEDGQGGYTCYNQLVKNLNEKNSVERKIGICSEEDSRRWKRVMLQLGSVYKSPLFEKYGRESGS